MNRTIIKLLVSRARLAQGSMALVEKQLSEILFILDKQIENVYAEDIRGEEENFESKFFVSPPLSVYDGDADDAIHDTTADTESEGRSH